MPNDDRMPPIPPARTAALVSVGCKVNQGELRQWGVSLARVGVKLVAPGEQVLVTAAVEDDVPKALAGARYVVGGGEVTRL